MHRSAARNIIGAIMTHVCCPFCPFGFTGFAPLRAAVSGDRDRLQLSATFQLAWRYNEAGDSISPWAHTPSYTICIFSLNPNDGANANALQTLQFDPHQLADPNQPGMKYVQSPFKLMRIFLH